MIKKETWIEVERLFARGMPLLKIAKQVGITIKSLQRHGYTKTKQLSIESIRAREKIKDIVSGKIEVRRLTFRKEDLVRQKAGKKVDVPLEPNERAGARIETPFDLAKDVKWREKEGFPNVYDLWSYVVDTKGKKYFITAEEGLFASSTLNIPYIDYQPAKRIYTIGKGIYDWKEDLLHKFIPYSNFAKLNKPEMPLCPVPRHDVDTINLTVGLPSTQSDAEIVSEDACILSEAASERLSFHYVKEIIILTSNDRIFPDTYQMKPGVIAGCTDIHGNAFRPIYTGLFVKTHEKIIKEQKFITGTVTIERKAMEGDKLTGLGGLKVVVSEVRPDMKTDLIVSSKQLWSVKKDGQKGAMVKELLTHDKIMVGLRKDTIPENQATRNKGASLSWKLYRVLALNDMLTTQAIINDNSRFSELVTTLHLKYDASQQQYTLLSETEIDIDNPNWIYHPHYLYNYSEITHASAESMLGLTLKGIDTEGKRTYPVAEMRPKYTKIPPGIFATWDYCWNASFLPPAYFDKANQQIEKFPLFKGLKPEVNTLDYRIKHSIAKYPLAAKPRTGESLIRYQIENQLFCTIRNGYYLVAIPQTGLPQNTIVINNRENFGIDKDGKKWCLVVREPVVGVGNIACVQILHDPALPDGVVRISLPLIEAMNADYDGDRIALIPYYSQPFIHDTKTKAEAMELITLSVLLNTVENELHQRTESEMKTEALVFMEQILYDKRAVGEVGRLIKRASFSNLKPKQQEILDMDAITEDILKTERFEDLNVKKTLVKEKKSEIKALILENHEELTDLVEDADWSYKRLLGFKPPLFWSGLFCVSKEGEA